VKECSLPKRKENHAMIDVSNNLQEVTDEYKAWEWKGITEREKPPLRRSEYAE
jgi:hypothetical protein